MITMKKPISINHLAVGMFLVGEVVSGSRNGPKRDLLSLFNGVSTAPGNKKAFLTGRMSEKVAREGGVLIHSEDLIADLRETGLSIVTIDTQKGKDLPSQVKPLTDPHRKPPPEGRLVHFDEEIQRAQKIRAEVAKMLKEVLENMASNKELEVEKVRNAGIVMAESILRNADAMVSLTRLKQHDSYTAVHCMNVCTMVVAMALTDGLKLPDLATIATGALLHDIGKIRVPPDILNRPGRLEPHALQVLRKHVEYGEEIIREIGHFSEEAMAIVTQHHEKLDGSGYPHGLRGDQIHPFARMAAVADVYDDLTTPRMYRPAFVAKQALQQIYMNRGAAFNDHAVDLLIKTVGVFPIGSLVELNTRERALVYEPNPTNTCKPTVGILTQSNQKPCPIPYIIALSHRSESGGRKIVKVLDPGPLGVDIEKLTQKVARIGKRTERSILPRRCTNAL